MKSIISRLRRTLKARIASRTSARSDSGRSLTAMDRRLRQRPPPQPYQARRDQDGADALGRQLHEPCVEVTPKQIEDREAGQEESDQRDHAPRQRQLAPPIDKTHIGRQAEEEYVVPTLRRD